MATLKLVAPAKVNLFLHVVGRRDDGYHLLETLVAFAEHGDGLALDPAPDISFACDGPFAGPLASEGLAGSDQPNSENNLVLKAARGLAALTGTSRGASIRLTKNIPVAAGLGGGSADAAATLRGLCRLWDVNPPRRDLLALAEDLGADVPMCLDGFPALVTGIGEAIAPVRPFPSLPCLLVNPLRPVNTGACFRGRQGPFTEPGEREETYGADAAGSFDTLVESIAARRNDLEAPAKVVEPEVARVLAALAELPACRLARMSGSGATCFALFADDAAAAAAARALAATAPDWWCVATRLAAGEPGRG